MNNFPWGVWVGWAIVQPFNIINKAWTAVWITFFCWLFFSLGWLCCRYYPQILTKLGLNKRA